MSKTLLFDFGTTRIKAAFLEKEGMLSHLSYVSAPKLISNGLNVESDAYLYAERIDELLAKMQRISSDFTSLAIATQRSSFLFWDKNNNNPLLTPLLSWQDRRAMKWCEKHKKKESMIWKITGLPLSPHYLGPKLAAILSVDSSLRERLLKKKIFFGTIDSYIIWKWTVGKSYRTDTTMAARTLLFDIRKLAWSKKICTLFNIPFQSLPGVDTIDRQSFVSKKGFKVICSVADQTAATFGVLNDEGNTALVNLGTGGFVFRMIDKIPDFS